MILSNINNLIIMTESATGDVLLDGVKHVGKQFGRGLTDIVHLGKFKELKDAKTNIDSIINKLKNEASNDRIKSLKAEGKKLLRDGKLDAASASLNLAKDLSHRRRNLIDMGLQNRRNIKSLENQLDLPTDKSGKFARGAGKVTTDIAIQAGASTGINAATDKLAASNNKEESK